MATTLQHSSSITALDRQLVTHVTCSAVTFNNASDYRTIRLTDKRVIYKTALITCKTLKTGQLVYLCDLLHCHQPARILRSSSQLLLYQPATSIKFQSKAFSITAPAVWNYLSPVTKSSATITTFNVYLKTELFSAGLTFLLLPWPPIQTLNIRCRL